MYKFQQSKFHIASHAGVLILYATSFPSTLLYIYTHHQSCHLLNFWVVLCITVAVVVQVAPDSFLRFLLTLFRHCTTGCYSSLKVNSSVQGILFNLHIMKTRRQMRKKANVIWHLYINAEHEVATCNLMQWDLFIMGNTGTTKIDYNGVLNSEIT